MTDRPVPADLARSAPTGTATVRLAATSSLTVMLGDAHRTELRRQAERYRTAQAAKTGSRRPLKSVKRLWLAAFSGQAGRAVADSPGKPLGTAKTPIPQGLRLVPIDLNPYPSPARSSGPGGPGGLFNPERQFGSAGA